MTGIDSWLLIVGIVAIVGLVAYVAWRRHSWPTAIFVGLGLAAILFGLEWSVDQLVA
ncbi:hypothetical protein [Demequina globuliformis]|uniref:hypothetical protein n=1 Tax=Demequina globuliformis TaxID=676202 RepID=UPI000AAC6C44|nr:hypothetical protein [Demequina globuliformis]